MFLRPGVQTFAYRRGGVILGLPEDQVTHPPTHSDPRTLPQVGGVGQCWNKPGKNSISAPLWEARTCGMTRRGHVGPSTIMSKAALLWPGAVTLPDFTSEAWFGPEGVGRHVLQHGRTCGGRHVPQHGRTCGGRHVLQHGRTCGGRHVLQHGRTCGTRGGAFYSPVVAGLNPTHANRTGGMGGRHLGPNCPNQTNPPTDRPPTPGCPVFATQTVLMSNCNFHAGRLFRRFETSDPPSPSNDMFVGGEIENFFRINRKCFHNEPDTNKSNQRR